MSKMKFKKFYLVLILMVFSAVLFGCGNDVAVKDIYFQLEAGESISLLIGENYSPKVVFNPTRPSNTSYELVSSDNSVLAVSGHRITALKEGSATLTVLSGDNSLIQDYVNVNVRKDKINLDTPIVSYNADEQCFSIDNVGNAAGYTFKINNEEIDVVNISKYSLEDYANHGSGEIVDCYDKVLTVQVRANAPSYTAAFNSSGYSKELKVYQASAVKNVSIVGGKLKFDKAKTNRYKVYLQGDCIYEGGGNELDLTSVDKKYSNSAIYDNLNLSIESIVQVSQQAGVEYHNSKRVVQKVETLKTANVNIVGTELSWQHIVNASKYDIYIDNELFASSATNKFNLASAAGFTEIVDDNQEHDIRVDAVIDAKSINTIKTQKTSNVISLARLATPTLVASNNVVTWEKIANANCYTVKIEYTDEEDIEYSLVRITSDNKYELSSNMYPSGIGYKITVNALFAKDEIAKDEGDLPTTHFISSLTDDITVRKQNTAEIAISNYELIISNAVAGDKYQATFERVEATAGASAYAVPESITITAADTTAKVSLKELYFAPGDYKVKVVHLGNGEEIFNSATTETGFRQFNLPKEINISAGVATIIPADGDDGVEFKLEILNGGNTYDATGTSYTFNSTNPEGEHYLAAGDVEFRVYAIGNGVDTFSYRTDGELAAFTINTLKVLAAPTNLTLQDATRALVEFDEVDEAIGYKLVGTSMADVFVTKTVAEFEIGNGETKELKVQAIGDDNTVFSSCLSSPINVTKLASPTLNYDNVTDIIAKEDDNDSTIVAGYIFKVNDVENITYDFASAFTDFVVGNNNFELTALAIAGSGEDYYINSNPYSLQIELIDNTAEYAINSNNELVITPTNQTQEFELGLALDIDGTEIELLSEAYELKDAATNSLTYSYVQDETTLKYSYIIPLLNDKFEPLIEEMVKDYTFKVKFIASKAGQELISSTAYSDEVTVSIAKKSNFEMASRVEEDNQYVAFNKVLNTNSAVDFAVLVNDSYVLNLVEGSDVVVDHTAGLIKFNIEYLYANVDEASLQDVNKIEIISLNTKSASDNLEMACKTSAIYVAKVNPFTIDKSKNNEEDNKSQVISFNAETKDYYQSFVLTITDTIETNTLTFYIDDIVSGNVSFNLDKYTDNLTATTISINGKIIANGKYVDGNEIYVFDSNTSNTLELTKLNNVTNIVVNDGVLTFDKVDNATGYDIFKNVEGTLVRVAYLQGVESTSYDLATQPESLEILIRAISDNERTNSSFSEAVSIVKLATPTVSIQNNVGSIVLTLSDTAAELLSTLGESGACGIYYNNGVTSGLIDLTQVKIVGSTIIIEPETVLTYGVSTIAVETLTFALKVNNQAGAEMYLNSDSVTFVARGLFAPISLKSTTDNTNGVEVTEHIEWANSDKNSGNITAGYIVKIVYNGVEYFTNDEKLLMFDGVSSYTKYPELITTEEHNITFPFGYDEDESGIIEEAEMFTAGTYYISVKAVPNSIGTNNYVSSKYSEEYVITVLETPILSQHEGSIIWGEDINATSYVIKVYNLDGTYDCTETIAATSTPYFDFSSEQFNAEKYENIFGVTVQAISTKKNILKSAISDMFYVYRMPAVSDIYVEDGNLYITANKYFTTARFEFAEVENTIAPQILTYSRPTEAAGALNELATETWRGYAGVDELNKDETFVIRISGSELLSLTPDKSYKISVRLLGNSNSELPVMNSSLYVEDAGAIEKTKLLSVVTEVEKGVFKFDAHINTNSSEFKHKFNDQNSELLEFFKTARIYELNVKMNSADNIIYALDYNDYLSAISNASSGFVRISDDEGNILNENGNYDVLSANHMGLVAYVRVLLSTDDLAEDYNDNGSGYIYFNVYEDNKINLKNDMFYYYKTTKEYIYNNFYTPVASLTDGEELPEGGESGEGGEDSGEESIKIPEEKVSIKGVKYTGSDKLEEIKLGEGGAFIVSAILLGGDEKYLSSNRFSSNKFERYGDSVLSAKNGLMKFEDMRPEDGSDYPIYKIAVSEGETYVGTVFLYYKDIENQELTLDDVKNFVNTQGLIGSIQYVEILNDPNADLATIWADNKAIIEYVKVTVEVSEENPEGFTMQPTKQILFDYSQCFGAGTYTVTIQTLAGFGVGVDDAKDYILDAKLPTSSAIYKEITQSGFTIVNGVLNFDLGYVKDNEVNYNYMDNYEITITDAESGESYVYTIGRNSNGVKVDDVNRIVKYTIPNVVTLTNGDEFCIENGKKYNIKIKGIAQVTTQEDIEKATYIVNAQYCDNFEFDTASGFSRSPYFEDGVLKWVIASNANYYNNVLIKIAYGSGQDEHLISFTEDGTLSDKKDANGNYIYYYIFEDMEYPIETGAYVSLNYPTEYRLTMSVCGNNSIIHSTLTDELTFERLQQVTASTIRTLNGELTWDSVGNADGFIVEITDKTDNNKKYVYTVDEIESINLDLSTKLDDNGKILPVGSYKVSVRVTASGEKNIINSIISTSDATFTKLEIPTLPENPLDMDTITWNAVTNAQAYKVEFRYSGHGLPEGDGEPEVVVVNGTSCKAPEDMFGKFEISISAIGNGYGYVFNGYPVTYTSTTDRPKPVGTIGYDETNYRFYFPLADDFGDTDELIVSYKFKSNYLDGNNIIKDETYKDIKLEGLHRTDLGWDRRYCYFELVNIGEYCEFTVQVKRSETLYSDLQEYADNALTSFETKVYYNIFAYGSGTSEKPYGIGSAEQLINIRKIEDNKIRTGKHYYEIYQAITLSSDFIAENLTANGYLISDSFISNLNSKGYIINISAVNLKNATNFALFGILDGASINGLIIQNTEPNEDGSNKAIAITNELSNNITSDVSMAVLAVNATDSTLTDITLDKTLIKFSATNTQYLQGKLHVSGLVAISDNTRILNCSSNVEIEFAKVSMKNASDKTYLAAFVASAVDTGININSEKEIVTSTSKATFNVVYNLTDDGMFTYVGAVVGCMNVDGNKADYGLYNVTSTVNQLTYVRTKYYGGIVGYAENANISGCVACGIYSNSKLAATGQDPKYVGGIVGSAEGCNIKECKVEMSIKGNVKIEKAWPNVYIGIVAGSITDKTIVTISAAEDLKDWTIGTKTTTLVESSGKYIIKDWGVCGNIAAGTTVTLPN